MTDLFDQLTIDPVDQEAVASWLGQLTDADRARVNELAGRLRAGIGDWFHAPRTQAFADAPELDNRLATGALPTLALLATADDVHAAHLARGIDEQTSWFSLADLGQQMRVHRWVHGTSGLGTAWWMTNAWADGFVRLGRLQFEYIHAADGEPVINVHIPDSGPLTPGEVDDAFARAREFFPRHYPEVSPAPQWFECSSWLLDPGVTGLVPGSNMAAFQQRFTPTGATRVADRDGLFFGFHIEPSGPEVVADPAFLDTLPTDTRLHRGLVDLWRVGGHVHVVTGRVPVAG